MYLERHLRVNKGILAARGNRRQRRGDTAKRHANVAERSRQRRYDLAGCDGSWEASVDLHERSGCNRGSQALRVLRETGGILASIDFEEGGASIRHGVLFGNGSAAANCKGGSFIDPCGLGALMPEEEPESPEEVRSQCKRCLQSVDE